MRMEGGDSVEHQSALKHVLLSWSDEFFAGCPGREHSNLRRHQC